MIHVEGFEIYLLPPVSSFFPPPTTDSSLFTLPLVLFPFLSLSLVT